jgi:hypothetical protein
MKIATVALIALVAQSCLAQSTSTVQMQCHTLASSNNFLASDEVLVNGMACKTLPATQATSVASAVQPSPAVTTASPAPPSPPPTAAPVSNEPGPVETTTGPVSTKIAPGATVFIAPMDGFENYLAAALLKKKVQLVTVANREQAQYVISGTSEQKKAGWAKMAFTGNIHSDNAASITMSDRHTGAVVFAYAVDKKNTLHGQQTTAEACAKHLQDQIRADQK